MVSEKEFNLDDNVSVRASLGDLAASPGWGAVGRAGGVLAGSQPWVGAWRGRTEERKEHFRIVEAKPF